MPEAVPFILAAGALGSLGTTAYSLAESSGGKGEGDAMALAKQQQDAADKARLRGVVGGSSSADAFTRTSGGVGPDFLANLATQQAGTPNLQGDALSMVKQLLNQQGGG